MVKEKDGCFYCEECGFIYKDKKKACECEEYCKEHKSCNLELIKYSLNKKEALK